MAMVRRLVDYEKSRIKNPYQAVKKALKSSYMLNDSKKK